MINHKGQDCIVKSLTCQEGLCADCQLGICEVCGANMANWEEVFGEKHFCDPAWKQKEVIK